MCFGEYFDYENNSPDFYLTEVSGIPFGLMGEMLQNDGNPWRGMIYGITSRLGWSANSNPKPLWKTWDDFGLKGSKMIGYWSENSPVKTNNPNVLVTVYRQQEKTMISLASWAKTDVSIDLIIDWDKLGIDKSKATVTAPAIDKFQPGDKYLNGKNIPLGKGLILIVQ